MNLFNIASLDLYGWAEHQKGNQEMELKRIGRLLRKLWSGSVSYWGKSLGELVDGISAKYKGLTAINWLNVHRLYDSLAWRYLRFRMFLLRNGLAKSRRAGIHSS